MILYHFPTSPFARRVRIALAVKGLSAELRDARANPAHREDVNRLNPLHTVPVLVDGDRVLCQSTAMLHHLDDLVPTPPLFPTGAARASAFETLADVDDAIGLLIGMGLRYAPVHSAPGFSTVLAELGGRVRRTVDVMADAVTDSDRWQAAEIAVFTFVLWIEGLPARAGTFAPAKKMLEVGIELPTSLVRWADQHRGRPEVLAL